MGSHDSKHDGHADDHHAPPPETAEQRDDRERSERVTRAIERAVPARLGLLLAIAGAGVSLALLPQLGASAQPVGWLWLLPALLATAWGLAWHRSAS